MTATCQLKRGGRTEPMSDKTTAHHRQWQAAKLMVAYWSDRDDEPTPRDLELIQKIEKVLTDA